MSTRSIILDEIRIVAAEQNKSLPPLTDDLGLLDSGLDSLCLAILVSRLEDLTGNDPFQSATKSTFPRTLGDLTALFEEVRANG
jgi:acyl carrier protein